MRAVVQRVTSASVTVDGSVVGRIEGGVLVLLGVTHDDGPKQAKWMANKIAGLRIFEDADGKMNESLMDRGLAALVVSQFTLYGDCRKGRRPSFIKAARPELADPLYQQFCQDLRDVGVSQVETGTFQAMMDVALVNDGPITLVIDSPAT